jgi:hypothetical protein
MKRIPAFVVVAMAAGAALSATGPASAAATLTAAHTSALPTITVTMTGKSIAVGGHLQSGGVTIVSKVSGESQGDPALIRLDPGVSLAQFFAFLAAAGPNASPDGLVGIASIVADAVANKGTSSVQAVLASGQYVALDTAGNNPASWPHTTFQITPAESPARLPAPQATIAAIDFGFRGPGVLRDGELLRVANHGYLAHMIIYIQARNATDAARIAALLKAGKDNQAQSLAIGFGGFAGPLSHGAYQQLVVHAAPGWYVIACFMNTQDGREHTQLGMERIFQIIR